MPENLRTSIILDLKGNLENRARRYGRSMQNMSRTGRANLRSLNAGFKKHGRVLNGISGRYTTIIGLASSAAAATNVINRDARLTQLQTDGRVTAEQIDKFKAKLLEVANDKNIRLDPDKILGGFEEIITRTGDFDFALDNLNNLATTIRATNSVGEDVGAVFSNFYKAGIRDAKALLKLTDTIVLQTFQGSVAFRDVAKVGNKLFAPAVGSIGPGEQTIIDAGAVAQIVIDAAGSEDEATEAIKSFISFLNKKDVQKTLLGAGVNVTNKDGSLRLMSESIPLIFNAAKGDLGKLGKLFGESAVKVFIGFKQEGNAKKLAQLSALNTDGSLLLKNSTINASTAKAATRSLSNKFEIFTDKLLSEKTKQLADAFDTFESTDGLTNVKAINFALGKTALAPVNFIGKPIVEANQFLSKKLKSFLNGLSSTGDFNTTSGVRRIVKDTPSFVPSFDVLPNTQTKESVNVEGNIKLEIESVTPVKVRSIRSNQSRLNIEVDTGTVMRGN